MRRLLLALAVFASLAGAILPGRAANPVPAEPDAERRTRYTIVATSATLSVGFDVYGDSTDYANWVEVYVNGVALAQSGNWTLSSPSGSLATLARPITDAQIQLLAVTTGTIDIVGARRPRRTSQFTEGRGISARDFNQLFTDLTMTLRERWDRFALTVRAPPGDTLSTLPPAATRANSILGFTATGDVVMLSPTTGLGTVVGPNASTSGNQVAWNSSNGTLVKDGGYPVIQTVGQTAHYFIQYINSSGVPVQVQPGCNDLTNAAASCSINATDAANISSGTLAAARIGANSIANSQLATTSGYTLKGNATTTTAAEQDLSTAQVGAILCQVQVAILTSGTNQTYTTPTCAGLRPNYLKIEMVGGGGGGAGGQSSGAATSGGASCWNSASPACNGPTLIASPGVLGSTTVSAAGGTVAGCVVAVPGGTGGAPTTVTNSFGGNGGNSAFGGAGQAGSSGGGAADAGTAAATNSGSGGGGGGDTSVANSGGGGGAGGYCRHWLVSPGASYAYSVGTAGNAGTGATGNGGAGAAGMIIVEAHWQ